MYMEFSEKLAELRRKQGMSQEQLADRMDVTRQSVSKWEGGAAMPELGKLIALSDLFGVSVDYLIKPQLTEPESAGQDGGISPEAAARLEQKLDQLADRDRIYSYTSRCRIFGLPLLSVRFGRGRSPRKDNTAVGVVAIGNFAVGILSVGLMSLGLISAGVLSLGLLALGTVAMGVFAFGAAAIGYLAVGVASLGIYAVGTAAEAMRVAIGAAAQAATAVGRDADGQRVLLIDSATTTAQVLEFLKPELAEMWTPVRGFFTFFLH